MPQRSRPIEKHLLTAALAVCLLAYHAINVLSGDVTSLLSRAKGAERRHYLDAVNETMAGWGHELRYRGGQVASHIAVGTPSPYLRLFYRREVYFQFHAAGDYFRRSIADRLGKLAGSLAEQGVTLVALPIPTKISIERDAFGSTLPAEFPFQDWRTPPSLRAEKEAPADVYRVLVNAAPGHVADLQSLYTDERKSRPSDPIFIPWDFHWTTRGISLAALSVLDALTAQGFNVIRPRIKKVGTAEWSANELLLSHFFLPESYKRKLPELQWTEPLEEAQATVDGPRGGRVVVVGTSMARRMRGTPYALGAQLARLLKRPLAEAYRDGFGPQALAALEEEHIGLRSGDVLVWEFPITELDEREWPKVTVAAPARELSGGGGE
jgi:hypothetical protein